MNWRLEAGIWLFAAVSVQVLLLPFFGAPTFGRLVAGAIGASIPLAVKTIWWAARS
jgi:hypothetical protein